MSSQRFNVLCRYYLLVTLIAGVFTYRNPEIVKTMENYETDLLKCFQQHKNHFTMNGDYTLKLSFEKFAEEYPSLHKIFLVIADGLTKYNSETKLKEEDRITQIRDFAEKLFGYTVRSYLLGSSNDGVVYHNICHGMFVAYFSFEYLIEMELSKVKYFLDEEIAAIAFAGLHHDSGHPGFGNAVFEFSFEHRTGFVENLVDRSIKTLIDYDGITEKDLDEIFEGLGNLHNKDGNEENEMKKPFILEDVHGLIASFIFKRVFKLHDEMMPHMLNLIKDGIDYTCLTKHYQGGINHDTYIVHVADVSLNGVRNHLLFYEGLKVVFDEFMVEAFELKKIKDFAGKIQSYCADKTTVGFASKTSMHKHMDLVCTGTVKGIPFTQGGFRKFVVDPSINTVLVNDTDVIRYFKIGLDNSSALFINMDNKENSKSTDNPLKSSLTDWQYNKISSHEGGVIKYAFYGNDVIANLIDGDIKTPGYSDGRVFSFESKAQKLNQADHAKGVENRLRIVL